MKTGILERKEKDNTANEENISWSQLIYFSGLSILKFIAKTFKKITEASIDFWFFFIIGIIFVGVIFILILVGRHNQAIYHDELIQEIVSINDTISQKAIKEKNYNWMFSNTDWILGPRNMIGDNYKMVITNDEQHNKNTLADFKIEEKNIVKLKERISFLNLVDDRLRNIFITQEDNNHYGIQTDNITSSDCKKITINSDHLEQVEINNQVSNINDKKNIYTKCNISNINTIKLIYKENDKYLH